MKTTRWIFFDVGSTLIDESLCYKDCIHQVIQGTTLTYDQFLQTMLDYYHQNLAGDHEAAAFYQLPLPKWPSHLEHPYPEAQDCLKQLHQSYKIGIIANQYLGTTERLKQYGLLPYIDLVVSSEEEGVKKPDLRIFRLALQRAGCSAEESYMIGDRLDNDIVPAKALGMKTIRILQGFGQYATVRFEEERPDHTIGSLNELIDMFL